MIQVVCPLCSESWPQEAFEVSTMPRKCMVGREALSWLRIDLGLDLGLGSCEKTVEQRCRSELYFRFAASS